MPTWKGPSIELLGSFFLRVRYHLCLMADDTNVTVLGLIALAAMALGFRFQHEKALAIPLFILVVICASAAILYLLS